MTQETPKDNAKLPSYEIFQQALLLMQTELSPAECQGIALGLLAWNNQSRATEEWYTLLKQEFELVDKHHEGCSAGCQHEAAHEPTQACHQWLDSLFQSAFKGLKNSNFGLHLYLPSDTAPLYARAESVSQWCKGFMYGLGLMGFDNRMLSNPLINEALQDISQIMNIEINPDEGSDESEKEYFELVEYLRMAALLIYTEITGIDQGAGKSAHGLH